LVGETAILLLCLAAVAHIIAQRERDRQKVVLALISLGELIVSLGIVAARSAVLEAGALAAMQKDLHRCPTSNPP
jgi:uncharacterized protein (DUF2336 family)